MRSRMKRARIDSWIFCWRNHFSYLKKKMPLVKAQAFFQDVFNFIIFPQHFYVSRIWHKRLWKEVKKYGKYLLSTLRERELFSQMGNTIRCTTFATLSLVLCWCHIMYENHFRKDESDGREYLTSLPEYNTSCLPPNSYFTITFIIYATEKSSSVPSLSWCYQKVVELS